MREFWIGFFTVMAIGAAGALIYSTGWAALTMR